MRCMTDIPVVMQSELPLPRSRRATCSCWTAAIPPSRPSLPWSSTALPTGHTLTIVAARTVDCTTDRPKLESFLRKALIFYAILEMSRYRRQAMKDLLPQLPLSDLFTLPPRDTPERPILKPPEYPEFVNHRTGCTCRDCEIAFG